MSVGANVVYSSLESEIKIYPEVDYTATALSYGSGMIRVEAEAPRTHKVTLGNTVTAGNGWAIYSGTGPSDGRYISSATTNDYCDVTFYGTGISIITSKNVNGGIGEVSIDGVVHGTFDHYAPSLNWQQVVYSVAGLTPGQHTCRVRVTGTKNPASSGVTISLDAFDIIGSSVLQIDNAGTADAEPEIYLQAVEQETSGDFLGKVTGSTVENKNIGKYGAGMTPIAPNGVWNGEYNYWQYNALSRRDNNLVGATGVMTPNWYPQVLVSRNLSHLCGGDIAKIRQYATALDLEAHCYGVGMNGQAKDWQAELLLWNHSTSQWDSQGYAGMQFSRASAAYNPETGEQVPANQPRFVLGYHHNLLTANQANGGEDGTTTGFTAIGSTISRDTTEYHGGNSSIKVVTNNAIQFEGVSFTIVRVNNLKRYTASIYIKGASGDLALMVEEADAGGYFIKNNGNTEITLNGTWQRCTVTTGNLDPRCAYLKIKVITTSIQGVTFNIDDSMLNEGLIAFDWLPGNTGRALMVEEGTTNLIPLNMQKFTGMSWIAWQGAVITLTQGVSVAEWGATDATRIQSSGGDNVLKYLYDLGVGISGLAYSASVWIKNQGLSPVTLSSNQGGVSDTVAPGESKRVKLQNIISNGFGAIQIQFRTATATDNLDVIAWRPKYEQKAYCTSWTPDTRAAESPTIPEPVRNGILNEAEGEISIWAYEDGVNRQAVLFDTNVSTGRMVLFKLSGTTRIQVNNAVRLIVATPTTGWHLYKFVWKGAYLALFIDGVLASSVTMPFITSFAGITTAYVGVAYDNTSHWNNPIDSIIIKNRTQADAAAIEAAAIAEYYTYSQQPFERDANTTYLQLFDDSLAGIMPFRKTITNPANYIVEDGTEKWAHMLIKSRYPSDGVEQAAVYIDYVRLGSKVAYAANPKLVRVTRNLAVDGDFSQGGYWGSVDATKRKYGLTPLGLGHFMRQAYTWDVFQRFYLVPGQIYSFGVWTRKATGIGNGTRPRISISIILNFFGADSGVWQWVTGTFTAPIADYASVNLLTDGGSTDITQNASDFAGFTLIPGSKPPTEYQARKQATLQPLIELGPTDTLTISRDGNISSTVSLSTPNLIANPAFVQNESHWITNGTPLISTAKAKLSNKSAKVNNTSYYAQTIAVTAGSPYSFAAYYLASTAGAVGKLEIQWSTGQTASATINASTTEWRQLKLENQIAPAGATSVVVKIMANTASHVFVDAVQATRTIKCPDFALTDCSLILQDEEFTMPANCVATIEVAPDAGACAAYLTYRKPSDAEYVQGYVQDFSITEKTTYRTVPQGIRSLYSKDFKPTKTETTFNMGKLWCDTTLSSFAQPNGTYTIKYVAETENMLGQLQKHTHYLAGCVFTDWGFQSPDDDLCRESVSGQALRHFVVEG